MSSRPNGSDEGHADPTASSREHPADSATETTTSKASSKGTSKQDNPLRGSRTSEVWLAVLLIAAILALLCVFILQNTQSVEISFFGWDGHAPLAAALLIATVAGMVVVAVAASLRLLQVRRRVRRSRR